MKYDIKVSKSFKQDLKKSKKRGFDISKLERVINKLADGEMLEEKYSDHALTGNYIGFRECHIQANWLLIYRIEKGILILFLSRTGTHSDLFN